MKKAFDQEHPAETAETPPEYDLSGGVRGKYARALRAGYTVKVHHKDGTIETRREEGASLFRDYGYLSGQAQKTAADIEEKHAEYFELFYRSSSLAQRVLSDLHVPAKDPQKLIAIGLMARLLEDAQGCALLVKYGIANTSAVALRSSFESLVLLKNCCTEKGFVDRYADSDTWEFRNLLRATQKAPDLDEAERGELKLQVDQLDAEVKAKNIQKPWLKTLACDAGMEDDYDTIYRLTSSHAHISFRSLKNYYRASEGKVKEIVFGPNDGLSEIYLYTLSDFLLIGIGLTSQLLDLDRGRIVSEIREELGSLSPKWPEELSE